MTDGQTRSRIQRDRRAARRRDRAGAWAVVALAVLSGVVAGHFGTHRRWEHPSPGTTTPTPTHVQGSP